MIVVCPPYAVYPMQHQQTVRAHVEARASISWPDAWKLPERPEPEHPSHEDPSPVYLGMASTANVTNASGHLVVNDSGTSGNLYTTVPTTWLQVGPYTVKTTRDLYPGERLSMPWACATNIVPNTKKHLANPSTRKVFEAGPGPRGRR